MIAGENLKKLFTSEKWQDLFEALSDTLSFALTIYSETGALISAPLHSGSFCTRFLSISSEQKCNSSCLPEIIRDINSDETRVFKCCAGIMNFSVSIECQGEKAVVAGRGSFENYEDFREYLNMLSSNGGDAVSLSMPLVFTSHHQTLKAATLAADSINRLLKNHLETATLRRKFQELKSMYGAWGTAGDHPDALYREMFRRLCSLLDNECISILLYDGRRKYTGRSKLWHGGEYTEALTLDESDTIVQGLLQGTPYVLSAEAVFNPKADLLNGLGALYFFPVIVHGGLEAILRVEDRALDEGDIQIILGFCKQAGLSIENYRLREDLHNKFKRFAALSDLTQTIASIQNDKTLLQVILDKSAELLKAEQGSLMMLDREADVLLVEARKGVGSGIQEEVRITRGAGIAGKVVELGEPLLVENLENDPRIRQKNRQHYKTPSFVSVPLKVDNRVIGVLNLADKDCGGAFNEDDLKLIQSFASQVAVVIERNLFLNKTEELKKLIITDDLTGLLNRRYLYERLKDELARSERHKHELSLLMLDLDGFKLCNDTHGHLAGDRALKEIAKTLSSTVRSIDIVVRFGGDEFMIILPETGQSTAIDIAERLRRNVSTKTQSDPCPLTISIGIACYPGHGRTSELLVKSADTSLNRAKNKGKNRIEVFSEHVV